MDLLRSGRAHLAIGGAAIALAATACGGSSSGGGSNATVGTNTNTVAPAAAAAPVATHTGPNGKYLTDTHGRTVYVFSRDTSSMSTCSGACAKVWPAYDANGSQVVYKGHPLYYFAGDTAAGDTKGQGINNFGGLWSMVTPAGTAVSTSAPSSSPSSSGGGSSWG